ncbi:MAG: 3'(2'),5'-bisphosphate nucleotidase CysQ [Myxococcota bacterium]
MSEPLTTNDPQNKDALLEAVASLTEEAGHAIMEVYGTTIQTEAKSDGSPITEADLRSQTILAEALPRLLPVPLLSEEQEAVPIEARRSWNRFWLVDPLDGTKDFVQRTGDFSVCVALIEEGQPVLGVIHGPVSGTTWMARLGSGVRRRSIGAETVPVPPPSPSEPPKVGLVSRFHRAGGGTDAYLARLGIERTEPVGSALKFCRMAEGWADIYVRLGPTMEWDVGAGDIIVREAGLELVSIPEGARLAYNTETLRNPHFMVRRPSATPPLAPEPPDR